ncbi:MAG: SDR family NAD(P)-dependent oxidoreductase [Chitinophagaceae bacterium]
MGAGIGWVEKDLGRGKAYRFKSPDRHTHEVFRDVVWHRETGDKKSIYTDRYVSNRRLGACPRRFAVECNVADEVSAENAVALAKEKFGAARILVNCAGIGASGRIVGKTGVMPLNDFSRVIQVNLIGSFNMMRLAASEMIKADLAGTGFFQFYDLPFSQAGSAWFV